MVTSMWDIRAEHCPHHYSFYRKTTHSAKFYPPLPHVRCCLYWKALASRGRGANNSSFFGRKGKASHNVVGGSTLLRYYYEPDFHLTKSSARMKTKWGWADLQGAVGSNNARARRAARGACMMRCLLEDTRLKLSRTIGVAS